jgi:exonuclease V gamma subunit
VVLDAFTDTLDRTFGPGAAAALTETHPLQPFDAAYFAPGAALFSYAQQHRIEAPAERVAPPPFLTRGALPRAEATDRLALPVLADAWARPSAHLTRALRIRLDLSDLALADDEPLAPDHLERYRLRQALAEGLLAGLDESALTDRLRQGGLLPGGAPGQIHLRQAREAVAPLVAAVRACGPARPLPIEVRLAPPDRAPLTVAGTRPAATPRGVIVYRAAPIRARDLVEAWAQHLALCAACDDGAVPIDVPARTYVFGVTGEACHFDAPAPGEARLLLGVLARGMESLRAEPVPLFPGASRAYAEKVPESLRASFVAALLDREREAAGQHDGPRTACRHEVSAYALKEARKVFLGGFGVRGDHDDLPVQLLTRGADPFADEGAARQFGTWAMLLWAPLLRALADGDRP